MLLRVESLIKKFGEQIAVNNVSFELKKGEITGFIGPNGSGKSTTMKIITGIIEPTSGKIFYDNLLFTKSKEQKRLIGYLPENNPLYYDMYVKEYLLFIADSYNLKDKRKEVETVIELTGLQNEKNKLIKFLSKGYKQRVGLAQAIIHKPKILILDEPTTGLDPSQIIEIRNLITEISKDKTIILSTHILQEVEAICHKVLFIHQGKLIANQNIGEFKQEQRQNSYSIVVEFKEKLNDEWIKSFDQISSYTKQNEYIWQLNISTKDDIRENIFQFAKQKNLNILGMHKKESTMEDTFREMTS